MSDILEFNKAARVREEASVWLTRLLEGLTPEQQTRLTAWLAVDGAHGEQLLELAAVWDELEVLTELASLFAGLPLSVEKESSNEPRTPRALTAFSSRLSIAASLIIALGVYWVYQPPLFITERLASVKSTLEVEQVSPALGEPAASIRQATAFKTAIGEQLALTLADGSIATLNTDTQIEVSFSARQRIIRLLHGEAHFKVFKDSARPLSVLVSGKSVQAVGTAFSVRKKSDTDIEVAVNEGLVAVYQITSPHETEHKPALQASLDAGDVLTIDKQQSQLKEYDIEQMEDRLAWRDGMIVINDETLDFVINEFSRYSDQKVLLADRKMGEIRVAGYFRLGDVDALLVALEQNFKIRSEYYQSNNTFVLSQLKESAEVP